MILADKDAANNANGSAIEVGSQRGLSPAHLKELAASGITPEFASEAGLYSEHDRRKLANLAGYKSWPQKYGAALVIPYHDLDGNTVYSRLKPERPPIRGGKPAKYLQPSGVKSHAYYPPGVVDKLAAGGVRIVITEGEKKSLCAMQRGWPTIGLSGVWNWQPGGNVGKLLPELERIEWHGREAIIAFDSDAATNNQVRAAEQALAAALLTHGATVKVVRLPGTPDGEKQGLDDYLLAEGEGAFERLILTAQPPEPIDPGVLKMPAKHMDPAIAAEKFVGQFLEGKWQRIRFWRGQWWYWERGGFRELPVEDLRGKLVQHLNLHHTMLAKQHVSNVMQQLEATCMVPSHLETPMWLGKGESDDPPPLECVATKTGVLHLPTFADGAGDAPGETTEGKTPGLTQATPRFFTTSSTGYAFDPAAPAPKHWLAFLNSLWPDDPQSIRALQRWFGYCLTPDTCQQKAMMVIGPKRSGKGTIARVLGDLVGRTNVAGPTLSGLATNFGMWPLVGKSLAVISDARFSSRSDQAVVVERLLSITGEDRITIDRKNLQPITCKLPTRFMVLTNELPRLGDASGALASRLIILHTPVSHYGNEDHGLTERLLEELPGIFCWAVAGWNDLRATGRFTLPDSALELAGQMADLSSPVSAFVRDYCIIGAEYQVEVGKLFKAWKAWCEDENQRPGDNAKFGRDLSACHPQIKKERPRDPLTGKRKQIYGGIGLLQSDNE